MQGKCLKPCLSSPCNSPLNMYTYILEFSPTPKTDIFIVEKQSLQVFLELRITDALLHLCSLP